MEASPPSDIPYAPAPWTCKARTWWILTSSGGRPLPEDSYAQIEEDHYAKIDVGVNARGPGMIQIVRYSETPLGAYDELLITPGAFTNPKISGKYNRITRIYVNQKATCWNGRFNWNIPKHLARFEFVQTSDSLSVKVFRPDDDKATAKPFFDATLKPFRYLPAIPFSIKALSWFLSTNLVLPPLPGSDRLGDEVICSTEHWKRSSLGFYARKTRLMWSEVSTPAVRGGDGKRGDGESDTADGDVESGSSGWWPSYKTWKVGLWMEDATLDVRKAEVLE